MKTTRKAFFLAGALLAASFAALPALAAELRHGEQTSVAGGEQIAGDAYLAGGSVTSAGAVGGDLYVAGGSVVVSGAVAQDLVAAGGNVTAIGSVGDDLRAVAGTIVVGGEVKGDLVAAGGQTTVSAPVGGDVIWAGGVLLLDAPVAGSLDLAGREVTINAPVAGNVNFNGEKLTLGKGAIIEGSLTYTATAAATMADGATVRGAVAYEPRPKTIKEKGEWGNKKMGAGFAAGFAAFATLAFLLKLLMAAVAALVLGLLFRRQAVALANASFARPWSTLGLGFAALILAPASAIALAVTVIGLPLAGLVGIAYAGLLLVTRIAVPVMAGSLLDRWVMRRSEYRITWVTILVGVLATAVLHFIPFLGWLTLAVLCLITFGALAKATLEGVRGMR